MNPCSSHDPNTPPRLLWSPAGHKNNRSDPPHWSHNDYVSRDEYSPTVGSRGRVEAQRWRRPVSLLLTLTLLRLWLISGKMWEETKLQLHSNAQSHDMAMYCIINVNKAWLWCSILLLLSTNPKSKEVLIILTNTVSEVVYYTVTRTLFPQTVETFSSTMNMINQSKFYLYSPISQMTHSSQGALQFVENTTPSVLRPSHRTRKDSKETP